MLQRAVSVPATHRMAVQSSTVGKKIVTSTCPGGRDRMSRLIKIIQNGRVNFDALVTHRYKLDDIEAAYDLFANQRDGVIKIAITP